ncbi:MAG: glycosyltransferase family 1 protein [Acidobacteriota bacterium]
MRVLIDYRPALRHPSGAGEYTYQLATALLAMALTDGGGTLDLTLFSSSWKDRLTPAPELSGAAIVDCRVPVRALNFAWHRLEWPPIEWLTGRAFDVVHSSHPLLLPARRAAQVVTIHDLHFLAHPEHTRAEVRRDYPALVRGHARRAARILVPSAFTAGEVVRHLDVDRQRIAICPPGAPPWAPRDAPMDGGYLLFFSTLEPRKNVAGLLDAYERLLGSAAGRAPVTEGERGAIPDLVLAGRASAQAQPWLDRLTRAPLAGRVRHLGYVDPADRQALYAGARLLVMPSFDEGFGIPVLEAMACGVPVVAAARGALPEVLDGAGTLVDPDDPADIAAGISRVLNDAGYAERCVGRGLARARAFTWAGTARAVEGAYRGAVAERLAGAPTGRR